ncbi:MAG TPA: nuclear transport factor 2 family protein [Candidatus Dormibacteraeota bacterium]|nr:nuclear transport factor 2 family protein [Candidatus Dormibacteraeota bacterium]
MSSENVALVRLGFEAIARGDLALVEEFTESDAVMIQPPEVPDAKTYEGRGAIREAMEDWPTQWEDFRMDLVEVIDAGGDAVVSVTRHRGHGRESGIEVDFEVFYVFRLRRGRLARMEMFLTREQALEVAGLREGA